MNKYRLILVGLTWDGSSAIDSEVDFFFETEEETFDKARFFLSQGYTVEIQNVVEEQQYGG